MSRNISTKKRLPKRDFKFNSYLVTLFINHVLKNGKKELAKKIVYKIFNLLYLKTHSNVLRIFEKAIRNSSPKFYVKFLYIKDRRREIRSTVKEIPTLLTKFKSISLGISLIIKNAQKRSGKNISSKIVNELLDTVKESGSKSVRQKYDIHQIAEQNRAFVSRRLKKKTTNREINTIKNAKSKI